MRMTWSALAACVIAMALGAMVPGPTTRAGSEEKRGGRLPSGCGWYVLLGIFAGRARKLIARPRFRRILERATGTVLIALGVRMAVSKL
jgi:threonine/homoserine/homoserine lactone efflux protein